MKRSDEIVSLLQQILDELRKLNSRTLIIPTHTKPTTTPPWQPVKEWPMPTNPWEPTIVD